MTDITENAKVIHDTQLYKLQLLLGALLKAEYL